MSIVKRLKSELEAAKPKMLSHHAPTKCLLERFAFKERSARSGRALWVYEKDRSPRVSKSLISEASKHGYFKKSGDIHFEGQMEARFNVEYEMPFNRLLSAFDSDLNIFESAEIRNICASYMSNLFHRSLARRKASELVYRDLMGESRDIADDPNLLRSYAALISIRTRRPVAIEPLKEALLRTTESRDNREAIESAYLDDLDRATKSLAAHLAKMKWTVVRSGSEEKFFISDTPVITIAVDQLGKWEYGIGFGRENAECFLPISHSRAIRASHRRRASNYADQKEVHSLNGAQICTMSKRLYGRLYSKQIDDLVQIYAGIYKYHEHVYKTPADGANPLTGLIHDFEI